MLKEGGRSGSGGHGHNRVRALLVVSEIALSLLLLIGAGLLIKSFILLREVNPGFDAENVLTMRISLPGARSSQPQQQANFYRELTKRVSALPGVEAAGATLSLPLDGSNYSVGHSFVREGRPLTTEEALTSDYFVVTPDYFKTMRIPVKTGRSFTDHDTAETPLVVVVNESIAANRRLVVLLFGVFAMFALLLASIGILRGDRLLQTKKTIGSRWGCRILSSARESLGQKLPHFEPTAQIAQA